MKKLSFLKIAKKAAKIADDKKGEDILLLNVRRLTSVADYFLIVTALSTPQLRAVSDAIRRTFCEEDGIETIHREGKDSRHWSVLDYGGLVVHVMSTQARYFYALDKIWNEAKRIKS
ncbi:MAG: ribosome silencing factor [Elusimicrobiota bacterium]